MQEKNKENEGKTEKAEEKGQVLPPLDFSSLVLPFYTQALVSLGVIINPTSKKFEKNLELTKRLIDLLDLLRERTKGNLKEEEEKFLSSCLHHLKMSYMQEANIIKL